MASKFGYVYSDPQLTSSEWACATDNDTITGSFTNVPYGTYCRNLDGTNDDTFASESIEVCKWTARRLGHPVMQLEFNSSSIYAMFEESVSEYSQHINNYNIKNWMWNQYASNDKSNMTGSISGSFTGNSEPQHPHLGITSVLSDQYGTVANIGGEVTMYSASIDLVDGVQEYDLQTAFSSSVADTNLSGSVNKRIEIQKVLHGPRSAVSRFWDPFIGTFDQRMMLDQFGFASYAPSTTFMLRPIYYDVLRAQAIETSDYIRRSNYSFHVVNNRVKIFPRPDSDDAGNKIWFHYYIKDDLDSTTKDHTQGKVTDPSNVPYKFITYSSVNAAGRQWIRKFCLALSKELLGIIRSKYASMPLPNGEVALDGESLKAEGREEKSQLLEELKEFLESVSLTEKAKAEAEEAEAALQVLNKSPLEIFMG